MKRVETQLMPRELEELGDDLPEVKALDTMGVSELTAKYLEVFGEPPRSRNRMHLVRNIAWRIQERAFGGLSAEATARIALLQQEAPRRWARRLLDPGLRELPPVAKKRPPPPRAPGAERDPRLPPPGTTLRRVYRGETHEVNVGEDDFEYRGQRFASLSKVALEITGTNWNGFAFFRLSKTGAA